MSPHVFHWFWKDGLCPFGKITEYVSDVLESVIILLRLSYILSAF